MLLHAIVQFLLWSALMGLGQIIYDYQTLIAGVGGFGGLIWQMRSQSKQANESIAENERRRVKAELYEEALIETRALVDAVIAYDGYLRTMQFQVAVAANAHAAGLGYQLPTARFPQIIKLHGEQPRRVHRRLG